MNFHVTVLKILVGFAVMEDLKRDMAILATSRRDWADRTRRLAARVPDLDIWSQGLVERISGGWRLTSKGREVLEFMEARPSREPIQAARVNEITHRLSSKFRFLRCGNPRTVRSGGESAENAAARPVNEPGRTPPSQRKSRQRSWAA